MAIDFDTNKRLNRHEVKTLQRNVLLMKTKIKFLEKNALPEDQKQASFIGRHRRLSTK